MWRLCVVDTTHNGMLYFAVVDGDSLVTQNQRQLSVVSIHTQGHAIVQQGLHVCEQL